MPFGGTLRQHARRRRHRRSRPPPRPRSTRCGRGCWPRSPSPARRRRWRPRPGVSRQRLNYHLRELERHGLIELVEERRKGNCTERVLRATAASYVISPAAFAAVAPDPARSPDQVSAHWMLALAGQLVRDVGELIAGAAKARRRGRDLRDRQRDPVRLRRRPRRVRGRARRGGRAARRPVPRRQRRGRARAPARRRPAPEHHPHPRDRHRGAVIMAKEFEIDREVELPGTPEDVYRASPPNEGTVAWLFPAGRRRGQRGRVGSSAALRGARRRPRRLVQPPRVPDRGARRRRGPALRAQQRLRRGGLGQPVRRRRPAHRLLPAHARPVPRALQPAHGDLRRRRARRPDGPRGVDGARRLHQAAGRARRARGRSAGRQGPARPRRRRRRRSTTGPRTSSASAPTRRSTASSAATRGAARSA